MHPDDQRIIQQIENLIGATLEPRALDRLSSYGTGYALNEEERVVGLSLYNQGVVDTEPLSKLSSLQELYLNSNQIVDVDPLSKLSSLQTLWLDSNQIVDVDPLSKLSSLQTLHLDNNQIVDVDPLSKLSSLQTLWLDSNQIVDVDPLSKLSSLQRLDLNSNQIVDVSPLSKLSSLQTLHLQSNQIVDVSPLSKLSSLQTLHLDNNQIVDVDPLSKLSSLQELYLNSNQIVDVDPLSKLSSLQTLYLQSNQIVDVDPLSKLSSLQTLYLQSNQIEKLPRELLMGKLAIKWEEGYSSGVYVQGNPLKFPPAEIVQSGEAALASYRASVERGAVRPMNEVKVLLVGEGGSGKTSLVKLLTGEDFDPNESQTHGINILRVNMAQPTPGKDPIHVRFWDFGGQEIMHATHQFFLSKRSVYVVVLDARKQDAAEYWLKHVESFGGASPVLVVVNKVDENPGFRVPRKQLQAKYPAIRGFFRVSCAQPKKEDGIKAVREALTEALVQTPLFGSVWSEDWFNVKTALEEMEQPYIDFETYQGTCQKLSIEETQTQETLVDFLHDLGVVLHFHKFDLGDTHVLDPEWVTQAVYKIINAPILAERHGLLRKSALRQILKRKTEADYLYPRAKHRYIIEIMKEFELCYAVDDDTILVPDLLDGVQEPDFDFDFDDALACILQYDFLPRSVMPRFIVKTHKAIKGELRWRTGVVLEDDDFDCTAVVRSDQEDRRIFLYVAGGQKRDYFAAVLHILRSINDDFEKKIGCQVRLPLPDNPDVTVGYKHLITLEKKGVREFIPEGAETAYNVQELLGRIPARERLEEEILKQLLELKGQLITDRESFLREANRVVDLKPNFFGLGVNLNALADRFFDRKRRQIGEE